MIEREKLIVCMVREQNALKYTIFAHISNINSIEYIKIWSIFFCWFASGNLVREITSQTFKYKEKSARFVGWMLIRYMCVCVCRFSLLRRICILIYSYSLYRSFMTYCVCLASRISNVRVLRLYLFRWFLHFVLSKNSLFLLPMVPFYFASSVHITYASTSTRTNTHANNLFT